jgi:hypothetical protein
LRFEELRQRDAEKVVKGVLDYVAQPEIAFKRDPASDRLFAGKQHM